jgi:hypothetical protein
MSTKQDTISYEEFVASVSDVFEQVASGRTVTVERNGTLFTLRTAPTQSGRRGKPRGLTPSEPLLEIIGLGGIIDDTGPTDVSTNKHKYFADAAADLHEPSSPASQPTPVEPGSGAQDSRDASEAL